MAKDETALAMAIAYPPRALETPKGPCHEAFHEASSRSQEAQPRKAVKEHLMSSEKIAHLARGQAKDLLIREETGDFRGHQPWRSQAVAQKSREEGGRRSEGGWPPQGIATSQGFRGVRIADSSAP